MSSDKIELYRSIVSGIAEEMDEACCLISFASEQLHLHRAQHNEEKKPKENPSMTTYQISTLLKMVEYYLMEKSSWITESLLKKA